MRKTLRMGVEILHFLCFKVAAPPCPTVFDAEIEDFFNIASSKLQDFFSKKLSDAHLHCNSYREPKPIRMVTQTLAHHALVILPTQRKGSVAVIG